MSPTRFLFLNKQFGPIIAETYEEMLEWLRLKKPEAEYLKYDPEMSKLQLLRALLRSHSLDVNAPNPMEPSPILLTMPGGGGGLHKFVSGVEVANEKHKPTKFNKMFVAAEDESMAAIRQEIESQIITLLNNYQPDATSLEKFPELLQLQELWIFLRRGYLAVEVEYVDKARTVSLKVSSDLLERWVGS